MTRHLITFLGRGAPKAGQYRTATYEFEDGTRSSPVRFFLAALLDQLRTTGTPIDRLRILGTCSSMWENLHQLLPTGADEDPRWLELLEQVEQGAVTSGDLDWAAERLGRELGLAVQLGVVPFGRDRMEQLEIVRAMAIGVEAGDRLLVDITHGFRHVPMLASAAASYVGRARRATVEAIYYGALEMTPPGGAAPVLELPVLGELDAWGAALAQLQATGDAADLASLCTDDPTLSRDLADSSFRLQSGQYGPSIAAARRALSRLRSRSGAVDPLFALAAPDIEQVLGAVDAASEPAILLDVARRIGARDPLRVLSLLREALVFVGWRIGMKRRGAPATRADQDEAWGAGLRLAEHGQQFEVLSDLRPLRNAVVHGLLPGQQARLKASVRAALSSREALSEAVRTLLREVGGLLS